MLPTRNGSIRLFRLVGIDVYLHWTWFVMAIFMVQAPARLFGSLAWGALEYLTLFLIVLMHEFGHALACRQTGGQANQIVLWPLGGVAYVSPPPRAGALLWSIAAGPLVNLALEPFLSLVLYLSHSAGWADTLPNPYLYIQVVWAMNTFLFLFNMLPVYPLDGGQILRSLLWFAVGRARSLMIASGIGLAGTAGFVLVALWLHSLWLGILAGFVLLNSWQGWQTSRALARIAQAPRRQEYACRNCRAAPPIGAFWRCGRCRGAFDMFAEPGICPHCGAAYAGAACFECGEVARFGDWSVPRGFRPAGSVNPATSTGSTLL